jgi:hypothetical protein
MLSFPPENVHVRFVEQLIGIHEVNVPPAIGVPLWDH